MEKTFTKNIFTGKFDNITNTDLAEYLGTDPDSPDLDLQMFNKIEQENIEFYINKQKMQPAAAKTKAAERKQYAMKNSGYLKD